MTAIFTRISLIVSESVRMIIFVVTFVTVKQWHKQPFKVASPVPVLCIHTFRTIGSIRNVIKREWFGYKNEVKFSLLGICHHQQTLYRNNRFALNKIFQ